MNHFVTFCIAVFSVSVVVSDDNVTCPLPGLSETFYSDPDDCSKYIECYAGVKNIMNCPPNLYWNQEAQYCDYKENVQCNVDPTASTKAPSSTTQGSTTEGPSTSAFTPDPNCPYPSDIITYDYYPANCSKFYECDHGKRYLLDCPAGLYWNHIMNYCDYPANVDCTRSTSTTPVPASTTYNPICANLPDGTLLPKADDCTKFYECLQGRAYEYTCPTGTEWNQAIDTCDYPANAHCQVTTVAY